MTDPRIFWNNAHNRTTFWQIPFKVIEPILQELPEHPRVLDIGCGKGDLLKQIHDATGATVEGIDVSDVAIAEAKSLIPDGVFRVTDFEQENITEKYDLIIFHLSLAFMDVHQALKKAVAASKRILVVTPVRESEDGNGLSEKEFRISIHHDALLHELKTFFSDFREISRGETQPNGYTPMVTFYCERN